jgi:cytochrome c5
LRTLAACHGVAPFAVEEFMSDATSRPSPQHDHDDGPHEGPIKTPKQLILAVVYAFVIPIALIALLTVYVGSDHRPAAGSSGLSKEAVAARIQPIGSVTVGDASDAASAAAPAAAAATPAPAVATAAATEPAKADAAGGAPALYTQLCQTCHASGVAGAPKIGDKAAWAPRLAQGIDGLTASAIKGKNAMPPKGGSSASEAELKTVVTFMVNSVK